MGNRDFKSKSEGPAGQRTQALKLHHQATPSRSAFTCSSSTEELQSSSFLMILIVALIALAIKLGIRKRKKRVDWTSIHETSRWRSDFQSDSDADIEDRHLFTGGDCPTSMGRPTSLFSHCFLFKHILCSFSFINYCILLHFLRTIYFLCHIVTYASTRKNSGNNLFLPSYKEINIV